MIGALLKKLHAAAHKIVRKLFRGERVVLVANDASAEEIAEITRRVDFYVPAAYRRGALRVQSRLTLRTLLGLGPVLLFGVHGRWWTWLKKLRRGMFDIDYRRNKDEGWEWCYLANYCGRAKPKFKAARRRFRPYVARIREEPHSKAYIFGTGPSLTEAINRDWADGFRIVCNTIVRDRDLWQHINPHFIVAADAIYHFGHNKFARAFRQDLALRLAESDVLFVFPATFYELAHRELAEFADQLIPMPIGSRRKLNVDLYRDLALPHLENVLALMLLPLGCTLARELCLWGFDGRAPDDKLFWANSPKHTYAEFMPELEKAHPAFFRHHVPKDDPENYVRRVHGDVLEALLQAAESDGWHFRMMHKSWTPALQKRFTPNHCGDAGQGSQ